MTIGEAPICQECRHIREDGEEGYRCDAYPEGIPDAIIFSLVDHHFPYKGDHGIQFEAKAPE